jgi:hypothetical protein
LGTPRSRPLASTCTRARQTARRDIWPYDHRGRAQGPRWPGASCR